MNIWWKLSSQWFFKFLEFDEIYISGAIYHRLKPLYIYWLIILVCNYFQNENILKIFPRYKIYNVRLRTSIFMNKWTVITGSDSLFCKSQHRSRVVKTWLLGWREIKVGEKSVGEKSLYTVLCTLETIFTCCQIR